jgi:hypothetical protein
VVYDDLGGRPRFLGGSRSSGLVCTSRLWRASTSLQLALAAETPHLRRKARLHCGQEKGRSDVSGQGQRSSAKDAYEIVHVVLDALLEQRSSYRTCIDKRGLPPAPLRGHSTVVLHCLGPLLSIPCLARILESRKGHWSCRGWLENRKRRCRGVEMKSAISVPGAMSWLHLHNCSESKELRYLIGGGQSSGIDICGAILNLRIRLLNRCISGYQILCYQTYRNMLVASHSGNAR